MWTCHLRMIIKNIIKNPFSVFKLFLKKGSSYQPDANQLLVELTQNLTIVDHKPNVLVLFAHWPIVVSGKSKLD